MSRRALYVAFGVAVAVALSALGVVIVRAGGDGGPSAATGPLRPTAPTSPSARPTHPPVSTRVPRARSHIPPALPATVSIGPPPAPTKPRPAGQLSPRHFGPDAGPGRVALRFAVNNNAAYLAGPGVAIGRGTYSVSPLQPLVLTTSALERTVTIDEHPFLRLHLTASRPGPVTLQVRVEDVAPDGSAHTLDAQSVTIPATTVAKGPDSNSDATLGRVHEVLEAHHEVRLTLSLPSVAGETVTVYYGALPGQDEGNGDTARNEAAAGGPNPSRLTMHVTRVAGAFVIN